MSKDKKQDINQMLLDAHKLAVKMAIDTAIRTKTPLVISENGKIKLVHPSSIQKKKSSTSRKKK
ncbi:MAG TPA: hypothetical protein VLG44_01865 [Chlamydiales bacterium]|nr:hypothetical protein [Chlamydiales bacterium]